ncbi:MAG: serine hydrolase, partial [Pseudomonadota bacterium]|nr:serine hydrolase [Pseudomonadota bacterium]
MQTFRDRNGFDREAVTLANWRTAPYSRWSFAHAGEMVPSARIAGAGAAGLSRDAVGALPAERFECAGFSGDLPAFLRHSQSDALLIAKGGRLVAEWWADHAFPNSPHLLFSVTKSVAGMLAGILQDAGALDLARCVGDYLPEARGGAYGDCPLQALLDMRVSLDFSESYLDRTGGYARYRRAMLWNPPEPDLAPETLAEMVLSIRKGAAPHGGPFAYQSPNSDVLGLV